MQSSLRTNLRSTPRASSLRQPDSAGAPSFERRARCTKTQPLDVLSVPGAMLTSETVVAVTGLSIATIYRLARDGKLTPVKRGKRCTRWRSDDVRAFLAAQG